MLDEILKEQGDFGVYGDLGSGLNDVLQSNGIDIEARNRSLEVSIYPLSGQGHDFSFIIDIDKRALTHLVVGEILPQPEREE